MSDSLNPPLSYEASANTTHPHIATSLPSEVISCLKNSRFVGFVTILLPLIPLLACVYVGILMLELIATSSNM